MNNPWKKLSLISPQREEGHREIENGVFRTIMKADLTASEYKIFFAIVEKTWGFGKLEDPISRKQFEAMTGLSEKMVKLAIKRMIDRRIVFSGVSSTKGQTGSFINEYGINKFYDTWIEKGGNAFLRGQCVTRLHDQNNNTSEVDKDIKGGNALQGGNVLPARGVIVGKKRGPCITHTKETKQKKITKEIPDEKNSSDKKKIPEKVAPQKCNAWKIWIDVNRDEGREDPPPVGKDLRAGETIGILLKGDEDKLDDVFTCYLQDKDNFLVNNGHGLSLLPGRINKYLNMKPANDNAPTMEELIKEQNERMAKNPEFWLPLKEKHEKEVSEFLAKKKAWEAIHGKGDRVRKTD